MQSIDKYTEYQPGFGLQYGASRTVENAKRVIKTAGQTEIRQRKGTKSSFKKFSCQWRLPPDAALELADFLDATCGVDSFLFTEPRGVVTYTVVCDEGSTLTIDNYGMHTVAADLREVVA